jgi:general secretion pathway protein I
MTVRSGRSTDFARGFRQGFTLVEVLVALVIVAFGISGALAALSSAADNAARMRDKSCAQWIGFNQIATTRLALQVPAVGTTTGELDYARSHWTWQQSVEETKELPGVQRLTVKVRRVGEIGATAVAGQGKDQSGNQEWLATTIGFRGTALSAASGEQPDWNGARAAPGSGGAGGGGAGGGGGGAGGGQPNDGAPGGRPTDPPLGVPR